MKENNLLMQIVSRAMKESDNFYRFKKLYDKKKTIDNINYYLNNSSYFNISSLFDYNNEIVYMFTLNQDKLIKKINILLYDLLIPILIEVIKDNNMIDAFLKYVNEDNRLGAAYNGEIETIYEYIELTKYREVSPFNLIITPFTWRKTYEGYNYWKNINLTFISKAFKVLLNENN